MKVITINHTALKKECDDLARKIMLSGFIPDMVLGIKSGGMHVAELLGKHFKNNNCVISFCQVSRKSPKKNNKLIHRFLTYLPTPLLDFLRIIEAKTLFKFKTRDKYLSCKLPKALDSCKNIIVVDDAVDSGATLHYVIDQIKKINNKCSIKTAVLTVTQKEPKIKPDFFNYSEGVLLRFPWSSDARKK